MSFYLTNRKYFNCPPPPQKKAGVCFVLSDITCFLDEMKQYFILRNKS